VKISKKQKKFIRGNHTEFSVDQLAKKTGLSKASVSTYLQKIKSAQKEKEKIRKKSRKKLEMQGEKYRPVEMTSFKEIGTYIWNNSNFIALMFALTTLIYANALTGAFISDDITTIQNNAQLLDLPGTLKTLHIQSIIRASVIAAFGMKAVPLHITSLLMHFINIVLVFIFTSLLFGKKTSQIATAIFTVHPLNAEAISWMSGNGYLINALGFITTFIFYILFKRTKQAKFLIFTGLAIILSIILMQDVKIVIVPPLILVIDQFFLENKLNKKTLLSLPLLAIPLIPFLLIKQQEITVRIQSLMRDFSLKEYVTRASYSLYMTLKLLFFPLDLSLFHSEETITPFIKTLMVVVAILFIISIFVVWQINRRTAGLMIFVVTSVFYILSPIQISWFIAERYLYIGTCIFGVFIAGTFFYLEKKAKVKNLSLILTATLVVLFSIRVIIRNEDWQTRKTLWEATRRSAPYSARVYNNLGDVYAVEKEWDKSVAAFEKAIEYKPGYFEAVHNLGHTYMQMGQLDLAEEQFLLALKINPQLWQATHKLGLLEMQRGNLAMAEQYFNKTLELSPNNQAALYGLQKIQEIKQE